MTPAQLNNAMKKLALRQLDLAQLFDCTPRQVRRWQVGDVDVPIAEAVLLNLMARGVINVAEVVAAKKARPPRPSKRLTDAA